MLVIVIHTSFLVGGWIAWWTHKLSIDGGRVGHMAEADQEMDEGHNFALLLTQLDYLD